MSVPLLRLKAFAMMALFPPNALSEIIPIVASHAPTK
jgi:hypothetical protein